MEIFREETSSSEVILEGFLKSSQKRSLSTLEVSQSPFMASELLFSTILFYFTYMLPISPRAILSDLENC